MGTCNSDPSTLDHASFLIGDEKVLLLTRTFAVRAGTGGNGINRYLVFPATHVTWVGPRNDKER